MTIEYSLVIEIIAVDRESMLEKTIDRIQEDIDGIKTHEEALDMLEKLLEYAHGKRGGMTTDVCDWMDAGNCTHPYCTHNGKRCPYQHDWFIADENCAPYTSIRDDESLFMNDNPPDAD